MSKLGIGLNEVDPADLIANEYGVHEGWKAWLHMGRNAGSSYLQYNSFSGADLKAAIWIPPSPSRPSGTYKLWAELQTVTVSSERPAGPVRSLGVAAVRDHVRGPRTIAGSLIFTVLDYDVFMDVYQKTDREGPGEYPIFVDMIPPFHLIITASNEMGFQASAVIIGCTLTNMGMTYSVDDLMLEQTYCVDEMTQALTNHGWKYHNEIRPSDRLLTLSPTTKAIEWQSQTMHRFNYDGEMIHWKNYRGVDSLTTPNHRWLTTDQYQMCRFGFGGAKCRFQETRALWGRGRLVVVGGGEPACFRTNPVYSDELVELIGWAVTEGTIIKSKKGTPYGVTIAQSESVHPDEVGRLRKLTAHFRAGGATATDVNSNRRVDPLQRDFYFGKGIARHVLDLIPNKSITPEFLCLLTRNQAVLLRDTIIAGDGSDSGSTRYFQQNKGILANNFQMLCAMLGERTSQKDLKPPKTSTTIYSSQTISDCFVHPNTVQYSGTVWCPKTPNMTWMARRNGNTFWTGNTYVAKYVTPFSNKGSWRAGLANAVSKMEGQVQKASDFMRFKQRRKVLARNISTGKEHWVEGGEPLP